MTFKPRLSFGQIINMNVGFFGIQYSFGLQQSAVNPIYDFLGATPDQLPLLNLAGPVTGLLIQPLIGTLSDKTWHPRFGRRKPYFFVGAFFCSLCVFLYPFRVHFGWPWGCYGSWTRRTIPLWNHTGR
jgi:maltose/moltooligosaccharide transporter